MKYSITVLQAEVTRFENGIKANNKDIKFWQARDKAYLTEHNINKDAEIRALKTSNVIHEKQIKELKADIKKL